MAKTKKLSNEVGFDYTTIKTFEDACKKLNKDADKLPKVPDEEMVIYKAINNGWKPDWNNCDQCKFYPWFEVLSSGFGFSHSYFTYGRTLTAVGSRLCTDTLEKALYIAKQFEDLYKDLFFYSK